MVGWSLHNDRPDQDFDHRPPIISALPIHDKVAFAILLIREKPGLTTPSRPG
jgi:hypothetical protein